MLLLFFFFYVFFLFIKMTLYSLIIFQYTRSLPIIFLFDLSKWLIIQQIIRWYFSVFPASYHLWPIFFAIAPKCMTVPVTLRLGKWWKTYGFWENRASSFWASKPDSSSLFHDLRVCHFCMFNDLSAILSFLKNTFFMNSNFFALNKIWRIKVISLRFGFVKETQSFAFWQTGNIWGSYLFQNRLKWGICWRKFDI